MVSGKSCQSLAVHRSSSPWYVHSMMGCLCESSMMASHLMPSLSQMESNKAMCWPCSAYCLPLCYWNAFSDDEESIKLCSSVCSAFGLTISTQKMQVMCQPAPHTMQSNPRNTVKGNAVVVLDKCTYLGSVLSKNVTIDDEVNKVNNKLVKASATFNRLNKNVWDHEGLSAHTKFKVYKAVELSTILYACET